MHSPENIGKHLRYISAAAVFAVCALSAHADKTIDVGDGKTLTDNTIISGNISNLNKTGDGTLVLSGVNTYTNTTTKIKDGILVATNAASLGSTSNKVEVTNGASLYFDNGFTLYQNGMTISGTGHQGEGALYSRSGINIYQGDLKNDQAATIGVATGSTFNITPNNINNNAALTFSTEGTGTIDITSAGNFGNPVLKTGTGTLSFSGGSPTNLNGLL